jgi:excinuclease ABC subunit C
MITTIQLSNASLKLTLDQLPHAPGVYRMLNAEGVVLYVGKATHLNKRVPSYFNKITDSLKTKSLMSQVAAIEISVTRSELEALLLESNLIKTLRPKYNVLLRDDKSYPYLHLSEHPDFPRVELFRSKKAPKGGDFFGPYPNVAAVKEAIVMIQKVFKLRNCRDSYFNARSRPCLQYQIKRCSAPCVSLISKQEYQQSVQDSLRFLQGKSQLLLKALETRMDEAVKTWHYEEAASIRDQIKRLRLVQEQQAVVQLRGDADVIAIETRPGFACILCVSIREGQILATERFFPQVPAQNFEEDAEQLWQETLEAFIGFRYLGHPERIPGLILTDQTFNDRNAMQALLSQQRGKSCVIQVKPRGLKARWLAFAHDNLKLAIEEHQRQHETISARFLALQTMLGLDKPIKRMECFDVSHTQGQATIASCVVFDSQGPQPKLYRRYNIEGLTPGDDCAALSAALMRRFKRDPLELPEVLIIDGGKAQVTVARKVLAELSLHTTLLGIAKGPLRKPGLETLFHDRKPFHLPADSKALHLLQQIRDEAHRFAITAHRKKRQKLAITSSLESIEGIGAKRRHALLHRFGGLRELAKASVDEIAKVPGISRALAERIYDYLRV